MSEFVYSGDVKFHAALEQLMVPIDSVTQHQANYNNGDVDAIIDSVRVNGMFRPIYVKADTREIIAGNHTWMACKELGAVDVPVVMLHVSDMEAKRMMIADNRTAQLARPDEGQLAALLKELQETPDGIIGTGFTDLAFGDLLESLATGGPGIGALPDTGSQIECPSCGYEWETRA